MSTRRSPIKSSLSGRIIPSFKMDAFRAALLSLSRVHEKEESLLTSTSGFDNYRGLINLCLILLVRDHISRNKVYSFICGIYSFRKQLHQQ